MKMEFMVQNADFQIWEVESVPVPSCSILLSRFVTMEAKTNTDNLSLSNYYIVVEGALVDKRSFGLMFWMAK